MNRIADLGWCCAAVLSALAGYAVSPRGTVAAQGPIPAPSLNQPVPLWPNQPKEATHWSIDEIRKAHQTLSADAQSGRSVDPNSTLHDFPYWTRTHAVFIAHVPEKVGSDTPAQHAGYAQFIVIMGGSGAVLAGGELQDKKMLMDGARPFPGEYRGASITGGETFRVQTGDWLSIPPDTPASFRADAGGLTYMVMKVNAMLYPWDLIR